MRLIMVFQLAFFLFASPLFNLQLASAQDWPDEDIGGQIDQIEIPDTPEPESTPAPNSQPTKTQTVTESKTVPEKKGSSIKVSNPQSVLTQTPAVTETKTVPPVKKSSSSVTSTPISTEESVSTQTIDNEPAPSYVSESFSSTPKHAGPPKILISRPVYAPYNDEGKTMYISAISEAYFDFKLGALPGFQVIPQTKAANNIQYFRDFSRRISRTSYLEAAKSLGASYLFYQEYEPQGKKVRFNLELYSIDENKKLLTSSKSFALQDIEKGLTECVSEVAATLKGSLSQDVQSILGQPILDIRAVESFGNLIVSSGDFSQKSSEKAVQNYEKTTNQYPQMILANFVTASACARAQKYQNAITHQKTLIDKFGNSYPALYLQLAEYYRLAGEYNDALDATDQAKTESWMDLLVSTESANIYESKGDLSKAKTEYQSVLSKGGEDGDIYFKMALVSIGLGDLRASSDYLSKASASGRTLDRGDYYDLGLRYKKLGSANDKAIEAFKNSLGLQLDNQDAWNQLAELYSSMGQDSAAAECYISLFQLNSNAYKDLLPKAGMMFEKLNLIQNAKDVYELYLARKFYNPEVSLRLAKIEVESGNCNRATELVNGMDTLSSVGGEVKKIMQQCGVPERRVVVPTEMGNQKSWLGVFLWRAISGVVTAGCGLGAYYLDTQIKSTQAEYNIAKNRPTVDNLHNKLVTLSLYRKLALAGTGVAGATFAASIAIPIIVHSGK